MRTDIHSTQHVARLYAKLDSITSTHQDKALVLRVENLVTPEASPGMTTSARDDAFRGNPRRQQRLVEIVPDAS